MKKETIEGMKYVFRHRSKSLTIILRADSFTDAMTILLSIVRNIDDYELI